MSPLLALLLTSFALITRAIPCYHIVNVQTGQYLQSSSWVDPAANYFRLAWLSHNNSSPNSLWLADFYDAAGSVFLTNAGTGELLAVHPNNDGVYVMNATNGGWMPRSSFLFRLREVGRVGEIVNLFKNYSLYAGSLGVHGGFVGTNPRCGLESCKWRFEGYEC